MTLTSTRPPDDVVDTTEHPDARKRRHLPVAAIVALVVLVLAEVTVRLFASSLAAPLVWGDHETQNKVRAMDDLARAGGASVVFTGSSMVNTDLDPHLFTALRNSSRPGFNAALNGSDPRALEPWILDVVLPRLHPETVVIGLTSRDFNDNGHNQRRFFDAFVGAPKGAEAAGTASLVDRVALWADDTSYLVRYRTVLRNPARMTDDKHGPAIDHVDPLGVVETAVEENPTPYANDEAFRDAQVNEVLNDYVVGTEERAALERLIDGLEKKGVDVVLVKMPITDDLLPLHPNGAADYDRFSQALDELVARHDITYIDATTLTKDPAMYRDPYHLNTPGRKAFTELMANRVPRAG